jgi:glycosyltransferase involved in cell wall biosynthesis
MFRRSLAVELRYAAGGPIKILPVADEIAKPILTRVLLDQVAVPLRARRGGYDLVVTLASLGPIWSPVPYLVVQQNAYPFSHEFLRRLGRKAQLEGRLRGLIAVGAMRAATINVAPSTGLADLIRSTHKSLAATPFFVLPHGIDLCRFTPGEEDDVPPVPFSFLCATSVDCYRGLEILLEATRILSKWRQDFEVRVTASDRRWPASVQRAIEAHRGARYFSRVRFIGAQPAERMPEIYRSAGALLHPSHCESFGFPLLESLACGLPIVTSDLEVHRELCGEAALYYPADSAEACAEAMAVVLRDRRCRRALRAAAQKRIGERDWSWDAYARRFIALMEAAMDGGTERDSTGRADSADRERLPSTGRSDIPTLGPVRRTFAHDHVHDSG